MARKHKRLKFPITLGVNEYLIQKFKVGENIITTWTMNLEGVVTINRKIERAEDVAKS